MQDTNSPLFTAATLRVVVAYMVILLISMLTVSTLASADDEIEQDRAQTLRNQGVIRPLEEILQAAKRIHNGRVIDVDLEKKHNRYVYEIEIVDTNGKVWEMKIDASSAELISHERDD